jgi:CheY-like chemotaxis protein
MPTHQNQEGCILLAEDRAEDALFLQRAFHQAKITNPIVVVRDGDEVIQYLEGCGEYANSALPVLLILDLRMPNRDGFQVLQWLRQHPTLSALRVIVLTQSEAIYDVNQAYQAGANSFMIKSLDARDMVAQAEQIKTHWIDAPAPEILRLKVVRDVVA